MQNINSNKTEEITNGYTEVVEATKPYKISPNQIFKVGKYKLIVWVKAEGSAKAYDSEYIANLNCVGRDDNNRVYSSGEMDISRDVYTVGEKVLVSGIKNISGMKVLVIINANRFSKKINLNSKEWKILSDGFKLNDFSSAPVSSSKIRIKKKTSLILFKDVFY